VIVVFDTTVLFSDVHASRRLTRDVLRGAASGDWQVVVPGVVVAEAVRQYPLRLRTATSDIDRAIDERKTDLQSLGLPVPSVQEVDVDGLIEAYERELRSTLSQNGCTIVDPPSETELVGSWAASRRKPFKTDGSGAADAFVWLTVLDQAEKDDVLFVSANWKDFADAEDRDKLAAALISDLERRGIDPTRVRRVNNIHQLLVELLTPERRALNRARAILDDPALSAYLVARISLDASWKPSEWDSLADWELGVDVDDFNLRAFDADRLELQSAEEDEEGTLTMLLTANGSGSFDFFVEKSEMLHAPDESPVGVYDWDWNDWYAFAGATLRASAEIDVRTRDDEEFETSIEALEPA
jgi:predicted nucleic acid-binding protein